MRTLLLIAVAASALLATGCATTGAYYGGAVGYNAAAPG